MMSALKKNFFRTAFLLGTVLYSSSALASSFYIQEQSVSGLGTAFAGASADTPDVSTIFYNPAGMTDLSGPQIYVGTHILMPKAEFKNTGSSVSSLPGTGGGNVAMSGTNGGNPFDMEVIPNFYAAMPLTPDGTFWGGIAVTAPFGLANKYEDDFFGRYDSTSNRLSVIDIAPSLAWAPRPWISLGIGLDLQKADAMLGAAVPSPITAGGPTPATDGQTDLSGDDFSTGFNAGVILKPVDGLRIGAHYRQGVSHTLEGRLITRVPSDVPGFGGIETNVNGGAELDLPTIIETGVSWKATDKLTVLGSVNWVKWSNFNDIPVSLADGTFTQSLQNYNDTFSFAVGARYQLNDQWQLKAGFQFDETPTEGGFRSTRIPDGDRTWVTAGATYQINKAWTLDLAGAYIDVAKEDISLQDTVAIGGASTSYNIQGTTEGRVGILSAGLRYNF